MEALRVLSSLVARHTAVPGGVRLEPSLGLRLASVSKGNTPTSTVYEPVLGLIVQGEKKIVLGDQVFSCGKGSFMVVSVDLPVTFTISRATPPQPYLAFVMKLRSAAIASLLLECGEDAIHGEPSGFSGIGVSDADPALVDAAVRLVQLLDHPRDRPVLGPIVEKEILWRLLCGEQGHRLRQIGLADSRLSQIGRAMRHMREHYREPLPIEDLARLAAMSVTSFHRHFRAVALMSPLQYVKQIRLQEARARLLANADDVATIGHSVGYDSPSQFSREYKRAYGSPPGEDARQLRAKR